MANQTRPSNKISTQIQEVLLFHKKNYIKTKLMLALIGNITEKMVNSFLGTSLGWDERNVHLGHAWAALSIDEKKVFDARIFHYFSKLPTSLEENEDENDDDEQDNPEDGEDVQPKKGLNPDEEALYGPLYLKLVNHEKIEFLIGESQSPRPKSGISKRALNHILRINSETPAAKRPKHSDEVRTQLRGELNKLLADALGCDKATFPKMKDPIALVAKDYPTVRIVRSENSTLGVEALAIGLEAMISKYREMWLKDIQTGAFTIVANSTEEL
ncbi:hypothetical protein PTTG_29351 [Puccinia triticina 1-1 BBBD Race 1]|uniref:Uncharacterized protein n=1 Tax=Puccinia triticina (isolate 1-1 / race 1 (BBBD)) TaxID=630390 RepID=A0A180G595_PUCT1|nr:hypothetical protein PTTG_29351 [Puccinia triticina 1-1 BBBD Race 1]